MQAGRALPDVTAQRDKLEAKHDSEQARGEQPPYPAKNRNTGPIASNSRLPFKSATTGLSIQPRGR